MPNISLKKTDANPTFFCRPGTVYHAELSEPIPHSKPILERFLYLLRTCKQTRNEVTFWYKRIEHLYNFTETAFFGPMDLNLAKFNLTVCSSDWEKCMCVIFEAHGEPINCSMVNCRRKNFYALHSARYSVAPDYRSLPRYPSSSNQARRGRDFDVNGNGQGPSFQHLGHVVRQSLDTP